MGPRMRSRTTCSDSNLTGRSCVSTRLVRDYSKSEPLRPKWRCPICVTQQQVGECRLEWRRCGVRCPRLRKKQRTAVTGQVICQCVLPSGKVSCRKLEPEPCFEEEQTANQVHHWLIPAGSADDCVQTPRVAGGAGRGLGPVGSSSSGPRACRVTIYRSRSCSRGYSPARHGVADGGYPSSNYFWPLIIL